MPYELPASKSKKIVESSIKEITKNDNVTGAFYLGLNDFGDDYTKHLVKITCNPINKLQVRRDALRVIADILEENNVSIPYKHLDVHTRK